MKMKRNKFLGCFLIAAILISIMEKLFNLFNLELIN